ncbi:MAG: hypothetical protein WBA41_25885 [Rivularia sp. (in: cyanobacteria)]
MAKYALLIGVSDYESNKINSLPGVLKDIEAMQRILKRRKKEEGRRKKAGIGMGI